MTTQRIPGDNYEERLLTLLKAEVAGRGIAEGSPAGHAAIPPAWRRRAPQLVLGIVAAAASAAAVLAFAVGGDTTAAFAVETQPEGLVSVEIRSLEDAKGLEEALDEAGIRASVNYLATGETCKEPRFQSVPWPDGDRAIVSGPGDGVGPFAFSISRGAVGPGQTLVITASPSPAVLLGVTQVEIAEGTVAPCEPAPAPPSSTE